MLYLQQVSTAEMLMFTQDELNELLDIIARNGKYKVFGGGLRSYPNRDDWRNIRIHEGCLELEQQGKIQRKIDEPDYVLWEVKEHLPDALLGFPVVYTDKPAIKEGDIKIGTYK